MWPRKMSARVSRHKLFSSWRVNGEEYFWKTLPKPLLQHDQEQKAKTYYSVVFLKKAIKFDQTKQNEFKINCIVELICFP